MEFTRNNLPLVPSIYTLQEISAKAGLSDAQVVELLDAGLDVDELLLHVEAMLNNRMN